jgi:hypothetical protein
MYIFCVETIVPEFIHHDFVAGKVFSIQLIVFNYSIVVNGRNQVGPSIDFLQTVFDVALAKL